MPIIEINAGSARIMNCKRDEYNIRYRSFDEQLLIGEKIRCVRLRSGLTIEQLSKQLGIDRTTLMRYEHNEVSEDFISTPLLIRIEELCGVPRYTLFNDYLLFYETCQLKELRNQFHITQKQLATYLCVDHRTINRWEQKNADRHIRSGGPHWIFSNKRIFFRLALTNIPDTAIMILSESGTHINIIG